MISDRKKPGVAFWATVVVVVVLVAYPLSFGPACWITSRSNAGRSLLPIIYRPILWGLDLGGTNKTIRGYSRLGAATGWDWWRWEYRDELWHWTPSPWRSSRKRLVQVPSPTQAASRVAP